jgi:hypothetical protein
MDKKLQKKFFILIAAMAVSQSFFCILLGLLVATGFSVFVVTGVLAIFSLANLAVTLLIANAFVRLYDQVQRMGERFTKFARARMGLPNNVHLFDLASSGGDDEEDDDQP